MTALAGKNVPWYVRGMAKMNLLARLEGYRHADPLECWTWPGKALDRYGYCTVNVSKDGVVKRVPVHRVAYEYFRERIPDGLQIDHLCRNKACFNPWHLEAVTVRTNVLRSDNICAQNSRKTHCRRGHPYTLENTYIVTLRTGDRERLCKTCNTERHKRRKAAGWKQVERRRGRRRTRPTASSGPRAEHRPATDALPHVPGGSPATTA